MKQIAKSYQFLPLQNKVILVGLEAAIDQVLLIVNVTKGVIIYNFAQAGLGGSASLVGGNTELFLNFDAAASSHQASDKLIIYYDDKEGARGALSGLIYSRSGVAGYPEPVKALEAGKRKYLLIKNESDADIFVAFPISGSGGPVIQIGPTDVASALPAYIKISALAALVFEDQFVPSNEVWILGSRAEAQNFFTSQSKAAET